MLQFKTISQIVNTVHTSNMLRNLPHLSTNITDQYHCEDCHFLESLRKDSNDITQNHNCLLAVQKVIHRIRYCV